jgi:KUP system potassium uptake protein
MNATAMSGAAVETSPADRPMTAAGALAALGIVYGDLGTSPLYTYQAIVGSVGGHPSAEDALGLLSLVVWALIVTVSIKYCVFVMRADNHGEGGILALMALVTRGSGRATGALVVAGLFGAALIYGDGIITPAISVLSALEGVNVATDVLKPYVVPAALVVLLALFGAQMKGTASIGRVFGPIMLLWFVTIAVLGLSGIVRRPDVIVAIDPLHAIRFILAHGWHSFVVLGGVFLAITGGEALYADMGHFGRSPIRSSWYTVVLPALLLCYAGQTALLLENPGLEGNPFFKLAPAWAVVPLVVLATLATVIASQAIITGAFSLTRQAMQLGWFPGLNIRQTSGKEYGHLRPGGELDDDGLHTAADIQLRQFRQPGRRLWHGRLYHHAADHGVAVQRHARRVALAGGGRRAGERRVPADRPGVLRRQPAQNKRRRMDTAAAGDAGLRVDDDLAPGDRGRAAFLCAEAGIGR